MSDGFGFIARVTQFIWMLSYLKDSSFAFPWAVESSPLQFLALA